MMMSLLERLNHAFSGGIMFVQPTAETRQTKLQILYNQWRSDGGAGRTGRHLLGAAKERKTPKM